jgi:branched-chain amino acid transport system substrate-binding protein
MEPTNARLSRGKAAAAAMVMMGVLQGAASAQATGTPIRFGAVSSLSGPAQFPESTAAVQAYFDSVNAAGGIRGRRLELIVEDDAGDPQRARQAARRLIEERRVVAMVGSASIVDCSANADYYRQNQVMALQGIGIEPACFASSHIVPVNTGPYLALRNALEFAHVALKAKRPCAVILDIAGTRDAYATAIRAWSSRSGLEVPTIHFTPAQPPKALLEKVIDLGCDAVAHTGVEPMVIDWVRSAQQRGLAHMPAVFLTPAYTARVAQVLTDAPPSIYCMAEFEPWSSRSMQLTDWRQTMLRSKVPLSSFSQGGYVAAQILVRALRGIDAEPSRASLNAALQTFADLELSMLGTRVDLRAAPAHNPNRATLAVRLEQGTWRIASPFWLIAPER